MKLEINMNEIAKAKLTEYGEKIHKEYWTPTYEEMGIEYKPLEKDENGYSEFQLHQLVNIFGGKIGYTQFTLPFDLNIVIEKSITGSY